MKKLAVMLVAALALGLSGTAVAQEDVGGSGGGILPTCSPYYYNWVFYLDGHAYWCAPQSGGWVRLW
jgi:hypothetical protein